MQGKSEVDKCINRREFASKHNVTMETVSNLVKRGLHGVSREPITNGLIIDYEVASQWVDKYSDRNVYITPYENVIIPSLIDYDLCAHSRIEELVAKIRRKRQS